MRSLRNTYAVAWPSLRHAQGRLSGLPFVVTAAVSGVAFGWPACFAALMIASVASFVVFIPLTALALNGGDALREDALVPPLTSRAYASLLTLWTATVWLVAIMVQ